MSIRKILIAVDEQPLSVRAAELGAELARALGGEVALIHVNAQGYPGDTGIPPQRSPRSSRQLSHPKRSLLRKSSCCFWSRVFLARSCSGSASRQ